MSALGHKRTCAVQEPMSGLPPIATAKADSRKRSVRSTPKSGLMQCSNACPLWANSGQHKSHSISSSVGNAEAERLSGRDIDDQLDFRRLLNRKVSGFLTFEDPA